MDAVLEHLQRIVRPALMEYRDAELRLDAAHERGNATEIESTRHEVLRRARTAAIELHQLSDVALKAPSPELPSFSTIADVRSAVQGCCLFLRTSDQVADVSLLRDVADAFKHCVPDRENTSIRGADAVIAVSSGFGGLRSGEGKYGGAEQVIVSRKAGEKRALSSVFQNVFDAWMRLLRQPLPSIGAF
ncbi:hypothetical protein PQJ75_28575 [Rhodoplanes sp. TEM]|uniref:Uncharacterized protein n=1 Tax=Rhodoplanes tepidamans TaxID=200616 RepID=A0ABT5JE45_RHOTP|nr:MULTISPECIES: hypothetical protein [Rhodoplanes]MDC7787728.1 hypothetical protein [Rhodoplanes tepidamans]MDC7987709.1 hypothetical protein [Rhodoplanes sp. TEM]MDQ0356484.1 hypothetical protein [Rhodoplanes tepidamans]